MEKALFDWPIVLQYDVKAKYRLISRNFTGMKFFHTSVRLTNQKPRAFVSVRKTNQVALFPFVCCLLCSRVFKVIRKSLYRTGVFCNSIALAWEFLYAKFRKFTVKKTGLGGEICSSDVTAINLRYL